MLFSAPEASAATRITPMTPSTTSASSSTTLRPRNRRRTNEDEITTATTPSSSSSHLRAPSPSKHPSRSTSPTPRSYPLSPARSERVMQRSRSSSRFLGVPGLLGPQVTPASFATGLWESSWSSLQGIAANLVGSDNSRVASPVRSSSRKTRLYESNSARTTSAPPAQWGPLGNGDKQLGSGTREDQRAQVQAKKRECLLMADGHIAPDASGRYKRRDSDERDRASVNPEDSEERDTLVYIHKVKPGDTLAGVIIKYNCQPNVFRKANRLWPNDSVQVRKCVVLPVDACGVKGRRVPESDLTLSSLEYSQTEEITRTPAATHAPWADLYRGSDDKETPLSSIPTSPSISTSLSNPDEPAWKHDSWVMIEGFPDAVEIARSSRKTLGYFPRRRRKSRTLFDVDTPSASFDLPRASRQSSSSHLFTKTHSSSGSNVANQLLGPGGVGTMGSNVRGPGPAQDGLNKLFAAHLPSLAPRSSLESINSHSSHSNGIENVGGAIEGWVRKLATKASTGLQPPTPGGRTGVGDLIELSEDAFELGSDSHDEEQSSGRVANTESGVGAWSAERERILQERFAPRGRVVDESSKRKR